MELIKEIFYLVIYTVITGAGVAIVYKLAELLNTYIDKLQKTTKLVEYEKLNFIIDQVQATVTTIVKSVNQTFVDDLKESGSFTKDSAEEAKNMALQNAKELITEEAVNAIEQVYGNIDVYLDNLVESIINNIKKGNIYV